MKSRVLPTAIMLLSVLVLCPTPAVASGGISGWIGSSAIAYRDTLDDVQSDLFTNLSLRVHNDSGFTFNLNARHKSELNQTGDDDWNLYSTYLRWSTAGNRLTATLGRRFLFTGVIRGFQDGLTLDIKNLHRASQLSLTLFAGQLAAPGLEPELASDKDSRSIGLTARAEMRSNLELQLSSRFAIEDDDDSPASKPVDLTGFQFKWGQARSLSFDGGVEYDHTHDRVDRLFGKTAYRYSELLLQAEYFRTESVWIPKQSWFSRFRDLLQPRTAFRLGLEYQLPVDKSLSTGLYWVTDDNDEHSINAHIGVGRWLKLGYRMAGNGDVSRSGIFGRIHYSITNTLRADAGFDFSNYSLYDIYDLPSYGSHARLSFSPDQSWRLYAELQHRRDRIMDSDLRGLIGFRYRWRDLFGHHAESGRSR